MNESEHLTEKQLTDYFDNSLDRAKKHEIGQHLLHCDFCLKRMPQPSPEQLWAALMTDEAPDHPVLRQTIPVDKFDFAAQFLRQPKILAWSAVALAVCLVFSAFIWLKTAASSDMEREVAENFLPAQPVFNRVGDEKINMPAAPPAGENPHRGVDSSRALSENNSTTGNDSSKQNANVKPQKNVNAQIKVKQPSAESITVSATRGGNLPKCSDRVPLELTAEKADETVVLKWKKIRGAAKYHVYVSDDEEILIDEFETNGETTYVLNKPLGPQKSYRWKVIVTLEDGKTIVGDPQKFTVRDLQSNQKRPERREKSIVRCSEGKLNR